MMPRWRGSLEILSQGIETMLWEQPAERPYMHHRETDISLQKSNNNGTHFCNQRRLPGK
jgi:hypothetical protein